MGGLDGHAKFLKKAAEACGLQHFSFSGRWPSLPSIFAASGGLAVLARYPILKTERLTFSRQAWFEWIVIQRGALMTLLQRPDGTTLAVLNLHTTAGLDVIESSLRSSPGSQRANPIGLEQLLEALLRFEDFSAAADQRIFCGDFNLRKSSEAFLSFKEEARRK